MGDRINKKRICTNCGKPFQTRLIERFQCRDCFPLPSKTDRLCKVEGCTNKVGDNGGKGMCCSHYYQLYYKPIQKQKRKNKWEEIREKKELLELTATPILVIPISTGCKITKYKEGRRCKEWRRCKHGEFVNLFYEDNYDEDCGMIAALKGWIGFHTQGECFPELIPEELLKEK